MNSKIVLIALVIVLAVSSTPASGLFFEESLNPLDWYYKVVCKTGCPINYDPKCAFRTADGTFLEFNNQCELDAKKCIDGAAAYNQADCKTGQLLG